MPDWPAACKLWYYSRLHIKAPGGDKVKTSSKFMYYTLIEMIFHYFTILVVIS